MKFTVKHALITCLALAILAMLLPWFAVYGLINISGLQIGCAIGVVLGFVDTVNDVLSIASGVISSWLPVASLSGGVIFWITVLMIVALLPFISTIVSLFMSIFGNSKKVTVAVMVMQLYNTALAIAYVILFIYVGNMVNNVAIYNMEAGPCVYLVTSLAAAVVSILILKRYIDGEKHGNADPSKGGLLCLAGDYPGVSIPLEGKTAVAIGRDASCCNLVVKGGRISRKHCEISYDAQRALYRVVDYSTNGTFVKGGLRLEKERPTELSPGTIILLGNEENSFRLK